MQLFHIVTFNDAQEKKCTNVVCIYRARYITLFNVFGEINATMHKWSVISRVIDCSQVWI